MLKLKMFAIRDNKLGVYRPPFSKIHVGEAIRDFTELANTKESQVGKYPEDFTLYEIGEYEEETGKLISLDHPHLLSNATDVIKSERQSTLPFGERPAAVAVK